MHFKMRQDAEEWFSRIKDQRPIEAVFDRYYFCLMLGLAARRMSQPTKLAPVTDFIDYFIASYRPSQRLIIGLFLRAEASRFGIELQEQADFRRLLADYLDPHSRTQLSEKAVATMNEYASGGFDLLAERMPNKPYHVEEFLRSYSRLLRETVDENPAWAAA